jgi:HK97 family phage prohead protease
MKRKLLTEEQAHELARAGTLSADEHELRKGFIIDAKQIDDEARAIDFTISTNGVDRMGDVIDQGGWRLENYRRNSVVLWAHDASMLPVAKASNVRIEDGKLKARATFATRDISGMANAVYEMLKQGFLNATSVGFAPIKYAFSDANDRKFGIDFLQQELLEFSICNVPANADCLIEARAAGIDIEPLRAWARKILDEDGVLCAPRVPGRISIGELGPMLDLRMLPNLNGIMDAKPAAETAKSYPLSRAQRRMTAIRARF